ncbi:MAG: hypothetical protein JW895_02795 [Thermoleophilaceae bacterium]|nr:hypothetical protein [Thermoleophilaceae bacterium]
MKYEVWGPEGRLAQPGHDIERAADCVADLLEQGFQKVEVRKVDARGRRIRVTPREWRTLDRIIGDRINSEVDYGERMVAR